MPHPAPIGVIDELNSEENGLESERSVGNTPQLETGHGAAPASTVDAGRDTAFLLAAALAAGGYASPSLNDVLYLHGRGLAKLCPLALSSYSGLKALHLENNALAGSQAPLLEALGAAAPCLRAIFLDGNALTTLAGVGSCCGLATLRAAGNRLDSAAAFGLAKELRTLTRLTTISLANNPLGIPGSDGGEGFDGSGSNGGDCSRSTQCSMASILAAFAACPSLECVDISDCELQPLATAKAADDWLTALAIALPRLAAAYLRGNPAALGVRNFRKVAVLALPNLQYLDDAPIFDVDRAAAAAWLRGGTAAEVRARKEAATDEQRASRAALDRFKSWQATVRETRSAALASLNAERAATGEAALSALPAKCYVSYGAVTSAAAADDERARAVIAAAESVALRAPHGNALLDLQDAATAVDVTAVAAAFERTLGSDNFDDVECSISLSSAVAGAEGGRSDATPAALDNFEGEAEAMTGRHDDEEAAPLSSSDAAMTSRSIIEAGVWAASNARGDDGASDSSWSPPEERPPSPNLAHASGPESLRSLDLQMPQPEMSSAFVPIASLPRMRADRRDDARSSSSSGSSDGGEGGNAQLLSAEEQLALYRGARAA